jgi:hypothetical protein
LFWKRVGASARESFSQIPGTNRFILGREVWDIGPKEVTRAGELVALSHSQGKKPWFAAFYDFDNEDACAVASPDGKYAMTNTHLYDLKDMMALVELPFPASNKGFLSDGKRIFLHDRCRDQLVFVSIDNLLANGRKPWADLFEDEVTR